LFLFLNAADIMLSVRSILCQRLLHVCHILGISIRLYQPMHWSHSHCCCF